MRVRYHASDKLPSDVAAALVSGECASSLLLNVNASVEDIAAALDEIVGGWVRDEWMHVGDVVLPRQLRALG